MNIIDKMIEAQIVENAFHASGMLNVLDCVKLDTDEQRLERCRLYQAWKHYFENSKEYTSKAKAKVAARIKAIAGEKVPDLPMKDVLSIDKISTSGVHYSYETQIDRNTNPAFRGK